MNRERRSTAFLSAASLAFICAAGAAAAESAPVAVPAVATAVEVARYVGAKGCQACHSNPPRDFFHDWLASRHARAFEALRGKEKTDPECLSCHATGNGKETAPGVTAKDLLGVQCEACHGPGSLYRFQGVMKDRQAALAGGMIIPTRKTCLRCHR
jgi:hypothetical protein